MVIVENYIVILGVSIYIYRFIKKNTVLLTTLVFISRIIIDNLNNNKHNISSNEQSFNFVLLFFNTAYG